MDIGETLPGDNNIMTLENLKQGDTFYYATERGVDQYEYLMIYPFRNPENRKLKGYHIILDKGLDQPKRVYYTELEKLIGQNLTTYEDAKKMQIKLLEEYLLFLKDCQNSPPIKG